jgi:hypothetical protein
MREFFLVGAGKFLRCHELGTIFSHFSKILCAIRILRRLIHT